MIDYYEQGRQAYRTLTCSVNYAWVSRDAPADVVIKFFLPGEQEDLLMISRPISKERRDWIEGFNNEKATEAKGS